MAASPPSPSKEPIEFSQLISRNAPPKDPSVHYLLFSTLAQPCARDSFVLGLGVGIAMIPIGMFFYRMMVLLFGKQLGRPDINVTVLRLAVWPFVLSSMGSWMVCRELYFERMLMTEQWKAMSAARELHNPSTHSPRPT